MDEELTTNKESVNDSFYSALLSIKLKQLSPENIAFLDNFRQQGASLNQDQQKNLLTYSRNNESLAKYLIENKCITLQKQEYGDKLNNILKSESGQFSGKFGTVTSIQQWKLLPGLLYSIKNPEIAKDISVVIKDINPCLLFFIVYSDLAAVKIVAPAYSFSYDNFLEQKISVNSSPQSLADYILMCEKEFIPKSEKKQFHHQCFCFLLCGFLNDYIKKLSPKFGLSEPITHKNSAAKKFLAHIEKSLDNTSNQTLQWTDEEKAELQKGDLGKIYDFSIAYCPDLVPNIKKEVVVDNDYVTQQSYYNVW